MARAGISLIKSQITGCDYLDVFAVCSPCEDLGKVILKPKNNMEPTIEPYHILGCIHSENPS